MNVLELQGLRWAWAFDWPAYGTPKSPNLCTFSFHTYAYASSLFQPWVEWFTSEVEQMPITNVPAHKRSFLPSRSEKSKVSKLVHAIKMGWMKTTEQRAKEKATAGPKFYMLWETDTDKEKMRRIHDHVSAPKRDLPGKFGDIFYKQKLTLGGRVGFHGPNICWLRFGWS